MRYKIKQVVAFFISIIPLNIARVTLLKVIFGYRIKGSLIGFGTIIAVRSADISYCKISSYNKFIGRFDLIIGERSKIGPGNQFLSGHWADRNEYEQKILIGKETVITSGHYIDVTGGIEIGDNSWIAGYGSQLWTHGLGEHDRKIVIGRNCYIGSGAKFAPGSIIGDNTVVGLGSVITKKFEEGNLLIAGNPGKIIRTNYVRS